MQTEQKRDCSKIRKALVIVSICLVLCIIAVTFYVIEAYIIPLNQFRNRTSKFDKYNTEYELKNRTEVKNSWGMESKDYLEFRKELIDSGWFRANEYGDTEVFGYNSYTAVPFGLSSNNSHEMITATKTGDKVTIIYSAYINIADGPFGKIK